MAVIPALLLCLLAAGGSRALPEPQGPRGPGGPPGPPRAPLDTVQYGAFTKTATYSIASQYGYFTENGLNVVYNQVPNSTAALASVLSGQYDVLTATVDNALNYRFNQNKPVTVLGQLDQGPGLVVASVPSITSVSQLKGKPIIVDSPVSGYAYLLRATLLKYGLNLANGDYYFMTVGGTSTRYAALLNGALPNGTAVYATILLYPFTVEGEALPQGKALNILANVSDTIAPITSSSFITNTSFVTDAKEKPLLTRFVASMYAANKALLDPRYKSCAIQAIQEELSVSQAVAAQEYAEATSALTGEVSPGGDFTVNPTGISNDVLVRSEFGGFASAPANFNFTQALVPGPGQLIDYAVRDAAVASVQRHPIHGNCTLCRPPGKRDLTAR